MALSDLITAIRGVNECPAGFLPLHAPVFAAKEREYVLAAIDSNFVSSVGAYVTRFEEQLSVYAGAGRAVACVNGTAALQAALVLAGVKPGDLVVTQALSFVATANAISHAGASPVFLDVEADTLGLSPEALQKFLAQETEKKGGLICHKASGRRLAACVPMHTFGLPCRIDDICEICDSWGLPVVEDAAEALGSFYKGRHCGTFGRLGVLSFNGNKIVTTGGGGAILTNDQALGARARHLTTTAKRPHAWEFYHDEVAWNYRLPNLNAALGCAQLERLDEFVAHKRALAERYKSLLAQTPWQFVAEPAASRSNYWLCAMLFRDRAERDAFLAASNDAGVMTRPAWEPLHTLPAFEGCPWGDLAVTMDMAGRLVNLPSGVRGLGLWAAA